jgi:DNA-directed RNA polymerase specialized sigma subunit
MIGREINQVAWDLELSVRSTNALTRGKILTLEQLKNCTDLDLLQLKGLGRRSLNEIKGALDEYGNVKLKRRRYEFSSVECSARNMNILFERLTTEKTLQQIADEFGITKERVRQIVVRLTEKIQACSTIMGILNNKKN